MAVSVADIAWLSGLLEGEACFVLGKRKVKDKVYPRVYINLVMTDKDIVERAAKLFGVSARPMPWRTGAVKPTWRTAACGDRAAGWMMTIYSFMGARRRERIEQCLAAWKAMPGKTKLQKQIKAQGVPTHRG